MARVTALGDVNADVVVSVPALPTLGGEAFADAASVRPGGSAANTALALAALGVPTAVAAQVGDDAMGDILRRRLVEAGVTDALLATGPGPTGLNIVLVTPGGERTMVGARGVNASYREEVGWVSETDWLHLSGYAFLAEPQRSTAVAALTAAVEAAVPVSLDVPGGILDAIADDLRDALAVATIVALGEEPLRGLGGPSVVASLAQRVAVTRGAGTVTLIDGTNIVEVTPPPTHPSDTTGAGDAFVAGLVVAQLGGLDLAATAVLATACGSVATRRSGTHPLLEAEAVVGLLRDGPWPPGLAPAAFEAAGVLS